MKRQFKRFPKTAINAEYDIRNDLAKTAESDNANDRLYVAQFPYTPKNILEKLVSDPVKKVADAAKAMLEKQTRRNRTSTFLGEPITCSDTPASWTFITTEYLQQLANATLEFIRGCAGVQDSAVDVEDDTIYVTIVFDNDAVVDFWDTPKWDLSGDFKIDLQNMKEHFYHVASAWYPEKYESHYSYSAPVESVTYPITCSASKNMSILSLDFLHNGYYNESAIEDAVSEALEYCGCHLEAIDFHEVDYGGYPEYEGEQISQCSCDFSWDYDYDMHKIEDALELTMSHLDSSEGGDVIGINFETYV